MSSVEARYDVSGERRKPKPSGSTSSVPSPKMDSPFLARFFRSAKISSCLRMRLAPSISFDVAISSSWLTCCVFSSDKCIKRPTGMNDLRPFERKTWEPKRGGFAPAYTTTSTTLYRRGNGRLTYRPPYARRIESLNVAVKKRGQLRLGQGPDLLRLHVAILEQHQRGYPADAVFLRNLLILVYVDLRHLELPRVFLRHFVEHGCDRLAGAAPFRPIVHQDRDIGLEHFGLECGVAHVVNEFVHLLPLETGFVADQIVKSGRAPRSSRRMLAEFAGEGKL